MKFPYELSEQRLSLLSEDDRILYEYEHSPFYSYEDKVRSINEYNQARYGRYQNYYNQLNEDEEFKDLSEDEKAEMSKQLTNVEATQIYEEVIEPLVYPILMETMTSDEYKTLKEATLKQMYEMPITADVINEGTAPGKDQTFWIPNMGWLGAIAGGILTTGLAGMIGLFMAGKDKAAAKALEKYMRKLVETVDMGLYKKKSFWNWLGGKFGSKSKGTSGDQSRACFRNIQELVERKMCTDILVAGKACGFFGNDPIKDAITHNVESGGLNLLFKEKIADKINTLIVS